MGRTVYVKIFPSWPLVMGQVAFQFETVGVYLRLGGEFANRSATHGAEPWIPGDQLYAAESEQGSSDNGGSRVVFGVNETPGHLPQR